MSSFVGDSWSPCEFSMLSSSLIHGPLSFLGFIRIIRFEYYNETEDSVADELHDSQLNRFR